MLSSTKIAIIVINISFLLFQVIGRLELGNGAMSPTATHHWTEVLNCPRRQIAEWHKLRD